MGLRAKILILWAFTEKLIFKERDQYIGGITYKGGRVWTVSKIKRGLGKEEGVMLLMVGGVS